MIGLARATGSTPSTLEESPDSWKHMNPQVESGPSWGVGLGKEIATVLTWRKLLLENKKGQVGVPGLLSREASDS